MAPIFVGSENENSRVRSDRLGFAAGTSDPGTAAEGDGYYNSSDNQLKFYDGSAWSAIQGSGTVEMVASGSLSNGDTVIINADGTVSAISETSASIGSTVTFETGRVSYPALTYDSTNNKVVIAYKDVGNSNYGTAVVGTVSGTSISFGTPVVFESGETNFISATYDPDEEKVVIVYTDGGDSDKGKAVVGTVSGTSISFGSLVEIGTNFRNFGATYDTNSNKVVIAFQDQGNNLGKAVVGTVSGTSISFGSIAQFNSGEVSHLSSSFDSSNNKVVIAYRDNGNSNYGTAIVGTVSGTSISFGSESVFGTSSVENTQNVYDSGNGKTNIFIRMVVILIKVKLLLERCQEQAFPLQPRSFL